jgi:hypothetical protein
MLLRRFLPAPSRHARRLGGGVLVINPAHILRVQFHPRPPEVSPGAWHAEPLIEQGGCDELVLATI